MMYRQGDVLVIATAALAEGEPLRREGDRVVLAHGELTGHAHAIEDELAKLFAYGEDKLLVLGREAELRHEEHETIRLQVGNYVVRQQCEYSPQEVRRVAD